MNADLLQNVLWRFGDHPDRINEFRKVIIALAISGRLRPDENGQSASKMLAAVEARKAKLLASREITRAKTYSSITAEDLPEQFRNPNSFVALGTIARIEKGLTGIQQALPGSFPLVVTAAERSSCDHFDFEGPAAIIPLVSSTGHGHASINRLHYQEGQFALGTILAAVVPFAPEQISARFLYEYLSTFKQELLVARMTGTANVTLSIGKISEVPVPLICPSVQRNVDNLMALCDQLETAHAEREHRRDHFALSTWAKINEPDPETFAHDARFALANLAPLTARIDQLKQLRQTILNLAVLGKLVEQDPNEKPAFTDLEPIKGPPSFAAPIGWRWVPFSEIAEFKNGDRSSKYPKRSEYVAKGIPWINTGHIQTNGTLSHASMHFISNEKFKSLGGGKIKPGDLLYCLRGATFGKTAFVEPYEQGAIASSLMIIRPKEHLNNRYAFIFLTSPFGREQLKRFDNGTAQPNLSATNVQRYQIPLPPIEEQHRIVGKVDELLSLCDQLEVTITTGDQLRSRLLEAVLHDALEPA